MEAIRRCSMRSEFRNSAWMVASIKKGCEEVGRGFAMTLVVSEYVYFGRYEHLIRTCHAK
jgi:hypothetical protein